MLQRKWETFSGMLGTGLPFELLGRPNLKMVALGRLPLMTMHIQPKIQLIRTPKDGRDPVVAELLH